MAKRRVQLLSLLALSLSVLSFIRFAQLTASSQETISPKASASDPLLKEIAGYRQWTRVNEKPIPVFDPTIAA